MLEVVHNLYYMQTFDLCGLTKLGANVLGEADARGVLRRGGHGHTRES